MDLFDLAVSIIAAASLSLGCLAVVLGALGLIRLGDLYQRMHGAGIVDTGGAGLILLGLLLMSPDWTVAIRVILIGILLLFTSPTATHAIARAAKLAGIKPVLASRSARSTKRGGKNE